MMINTTLDRLVENYQALDSWDDRFAFVISLGKQLPEMAEELKDEDHRVLGCMSRVWINMEPKFKLEDPLYFLADSDAAIVKGLIAVLMVVFQDKTPVEALKVDIDSIFSKLELDQHLSPGRTNGFHSMVKRIKQLCLQRVLQVQKGL